MTLYMKATIIIVISVTINKIFSVKLHDLENDLQNGPRSNVNMPSESPYMTFSTMAIVLFHVSVTLYEIFTIKTFMILTLTLRVGEGRM